MDTKSHNALTNAQRARDQALRRVLRVRRLTIIGAGALTAGLAGLVSAVAPGRSLGARTKVAAATRTAKPVRRPSTAGLRMPPLASPSQLGLQAPGAAPQPVAPSDQGAPAPQQSAPAPQQSAPAAPQPAAPQPAAPQPAAPGGGVVSGGS
jgi:F0F1-type ATP synthase membrane subunit c/vacuolar-type H+-ATPase subunit K